MVKPKYKDLSINKQCSLLKLNRSSYYYKPKGESEQNLSLMRIIDEQYLKYPFFGSRQMKRRLQSIGHLVSRHRVRRLMKKMGLVAIYQKPKTSIKNVAHKIYPYLLKHLTISGNVNLVEQN